VLWIHAFAHVLTGELASTSPGQIRLMRSLNRAVARLAENESRSREELPRDLSPELRKTGLSPELTGMQSDQPPTSTRRSPR
jgi:hypothetical protein